jgi:TctA family transporter
LHKPYCYLNIVTGVCTAMIILLPIGVLTSAVSDVMLGTIFFHAATEPKPDLTAA